MLDVFAFVQCLKHQETVDTILKIFDSTDTCKDEDWSGIDDDFE